MLAVVEVRLRVRLWSEAAGYWLQNEVRLALDWLISVVDSLGIAGWFGSSFAAGLLRLALAGRRVARDAGVDPLAPLVALLDVATRRAFMGAG